jgi:hypothetical protein
MTISPGAIPFLRMSFFIAAQLAMRLLFLFETHHAAFARGRFFGARLFKRRSLCHRLGRAWCFGTAAGTVLHKRLQTFYGPRAKTSANLGCLCFFRGRFLHSTMRSDERVHTDLSDRCEPQRDYAFNLKDCELFRFRIRAASLRKISCLISARDFRSGSSDLGPGIWIA